MARLCRRPNARRPSDAGLLSHFAFDNGGDCPLKIPGFNGVPVDVELVEEERFAHGAHDWRQDRLTGREVMMLRVMNALTDREDWATKIFDDSAVAEWREEAMEVPFMSSKAWDWCVAELRDKSSELRATKRVRVFDSASRVCKSDALIPPGLLEQLQRSVSPLLGAPPHLKDWQPGSDKQILNLVDPSLFPLVLGRSSVLVDSGRVELGQTMASFGGGTRLGTTSFNARDREKQWHGRGSQRALPHLWSGKFQWLPSEIDFVGDGSRVKIASYVNNLHPDQHQTLYSHLETVLASAIPAWNDVLLQPGQAWVPPRIRICGVQTEPEYPSWARDLPDDAQDPGYPQARVMVEEYLQQRDHAPDDRYPP